MAACLARGLTKRANADALVISEGTAEVHVKHILNKLNLSSRTQVALWAAGQGLLAPEST